MLNTQSKIVEKFNLNFYSVFPDEPPISVTINLTKAEIAYNSSGSDLNKLLRNTLLLTFITTIYF